MARIFYIMAFLFLITLNTIGAEEFSMEISLNNPGEYNIFNESIHLKNYKSNMTIVKKIDREGKVSFNTEELTANFSDFQIIGATICFQPLKECRGYVFYFPLMDRLGKKLTVELEGMVQTYIPINSTDHPSFSFSDTDLLFIMQFAFIESGITELTIKQGGFIEEEGIKKYGFEPLKFPPDGLYFIGGYASDGLNNILHVYPYIQKTVELKTNIVPKKVTVDLVKEMGYFEDGSQTKEFKLWPFQIKQIKYYCSDKGCSGKEPTIIIDVDINLTISITIVSIGGISICIFFMRKWFKKRKKKSPSSISQSTH